MKNLLFISLVIFASCSNSAENKAVRAANSLIEANDSLTEYNSKVATLNAEMRRATADIELKKKLLNDVNGFKVFRTSTEKQKQVSDASANLADALKRFEQLANSRAELDNVIHALNLRILSMR